MRPKAGRELEYMRESGRMLAAVLTYAVAEAESGMTTQELNDLAEKELEKLGGKPAFKGYQGFPAGMCISLNGEIVHGIPSGKVMRSGDLLSMDFGVNYSGMITDSALTMFVDGQSTGQTRKLIKATEESMYAGIEQVKAGARVGAISEAVERRLRRDGLGIVEDLVGHGVGHKLHEEPEIPNFTDNEVQNRKLKAGMTIAIEPMATLGRKEVTVAEDGWTIVSADGTLSAHFEHTVLVTEDGYEVLTRR